MEIREITANKKQYYDLLLLADEQPEMIERYLHCGTMYVLFDPDPVAECIVTDECSGILEIKSIAVDPAYQGCGYGKSLIAFLTETYRRSHSVLQAGTGDSPLTVPFYEACGFRRHHVIPDFFIDHYDHPIIEAGVQLRDMIVFRLPLQGG